MIYGCGTMGSGAGGRNMEEKCSFKIEKIEVVLFKCKSGDSRLQSGIDDQKTIKKEKERREKELT